VFWIVAVLAALLLGYAVPRLWVVPILPVAIVLTVTVGSIFENTGECTRPDGCGAGPVAQAILFALTLGALLAASTGVGIWLRRRD
jgi:hypothetical protein